MTFGIPQINMSNQKLESSSPSFQFEILPVGKEEESTGNLFVVKTQHCHVQRNEKESERVRRRLCITSVVCVGFMIAEITGGILANSLALATDAAHLLTDFASFMISILSLWLATKPATMKLNFGWHRAEILGALISVLTIWVLTGILVYMAVERIVGGNYEIDATMMLIIAGVGVLANIVMFILLSKDGLRQHTHKSKSIVKKETSGNINIRAAIIHVIGDFVQCIGVLVAALIIYFKPEYKIADPICTFFFSVLVLITTLNIIKDILVVLMEGIPKGVKFDEIRNVILAIPGVVKVHNLRVWALSMEKISLSAHVVIAKGEDSIDILKKASNGIMAKLDVFELTLQVEEYNDDMQHCSLCQEPYS